MSINIAVIGECMLELRQTRGLATGNSKPMVMGFGGDTLNTSLYLARNEISASYVTALGDDPNSDWLVDEWTKEGIDCELIERAQNSVPGMYLIDTDEDGERSFFYWRKDSPASQLFNDEAKVAQLFEKLAKFEYLYLSGISLAILPEEALTRLFNYLAKYRESGGRLIFDGNYRPTLWTSEAVAQQSYRTMYQMTDIALPTLEDEAMLFHYSSPEEVIEAIKADGVKEIVVKMGDEGCVSSFNGSVEFVAAKPTKPVDTTAAGDSFNAAYLAARFKDENVVDACNCGHSLASQVIQNKGAIIPRD